MYLSSTPASHAGSKVLVHGKATRHTCHRLQEQDPGKPFRPAHKLVGPVACDRVKRPPHRRDRPVPRPFHRRRGLLVSRMDAMHILRGVHRVPAGRKRRSTILSKYGKRGERKFRDTLGTCETSISLFTMKYLAKTQSYYSLQSIFSTYSQPLYNDRRCRCILFYKRNGKFHAWSMTAPQQ